MKISYAKQPVIQDEGAHQDSAIEWWFVQGYYQGPGLGQRYFMASFFKHNIEELSLGNDQGFSFLLSILDPETGKQEAVSRINPDAVSYFIDNASKIQNSNLDQRLIEAYARELKTYGPFKPITVEDEDVKFKSGPLNITWKDFGLKQEGNIFKLEFCEPQSNRACFLDLTPVQSRAHIEDFKIQALDSMDYAIYPQLSLRGKVQGQDVEGKAWLNHQWGNCAGWFIRPSSKKKFLGWEWLGINLDDGTDIMIMVHRDMQNKRSFARYAVVVGNDGSARLIRKFKTKALRYWESPDTRSSYPLAWKIEIPEIDADLVFQPLADEQEIRVFGVVRAIWEGCGKISGTVFGRKACGRARLELHGYSYIFDFQDYLKILTKRIDRCIEQYFPKVIDEKQVEKYLGAPYWKHEAKAYTATISEPVWDLMLRQGKHWRPIFSIFLLEALGVNSSRYETLISVVSELSHTGALIIDDIEDSSLLRRGEESIHLRYGLDVAINAANTIYFLPYLQLADHPGLTDKQRLELHQIMIKQFVRSHFGQGLDIYWSKNMTVRNLSRWLGDSLGDKILQMYAYKTASAVEGLAEVTCVLANADEKTRQTCVSLARAFGVTFQIIDDVLNFSDSPKWTKTCAEDLWEGKLTYVIQRSLENLNPAKRRRLQAILCSKKLRQNRKVLQEGISLVRESKALQFCQEEAIARLDKAWQDFSGTVASSEAKIMLHILCMSLLNIAYEV